MPLLNKRSYTPGARANLIPGEIGINLSDDKLLIRGDQRKLEIDLDKWRRRAPGKVGSIGSPLSVEADGVVWADNLAPSGLADGRALVDAPPADWGVLGLYPYAIGTAAMVADDVRLEPFWVASDSIYLETLGIKVESGSGGALRLGIFDETDSLWFDGLIAASVSGMNVLTPNISLPRGLYKAVVWAGAPVGLTTLAGHRFNQSFAVDIDTSPLFTRFTSSSANMANGLYTGGLFLSDEVSTEAGEDHAIVMHWSLP